MSDTQSESLIRNMTEGPLARQMIRYALPIMGANLLQALYTLVDLWAVGKFANAAAISAVSVSSQIVLLIHSVGIGLGSGGQVLISQQVGARDTHRLSATIGTLISFCVLASCVVALVGGLGANVWISVLNTPAQAKSGAINYLIICCLGAPFMCISGTMCAILRGVGQSRTPMFILAVSAGSNIVMDFLLVAGLGMGAEGAAIATTLAQLFGAIYAVCYVYRHKKALGFDFKPASFQIARGPLVAILKLGTPLVVQSACISFSTIFITAFINSYGVAASAITGIGSKLNTMINVVFQAINTAVGSLVAQNFAAGKMDRVRKVNRIGSLICICVFAVLGSLVLLFPVQIVGLFTKATETEVLGLAKEYMFIMFWNYMACALMSTPLGHINGVGYTTLNLIISLLDGVAGRIGLSLFLGYVLNMGVTAYWWGNSIASFVSVVMAYGYYLLCHWEKRGRLVDSI